MTAEQTLYLIVYILFQLLKITLSALAVWFTVRTLIRKYGGRFCLLDALSGCFDPLSGRNGA